MDNNAIAIDIGRSFTKVYYKGKKAKMPSAVCFSTDVGNSFGEESVYDFEGDKYLVGSDAVSSEAFTTSDYKYIEKFSPLIIHHILEKFDERDISRPIELKCGLAINDWAHKDEYAARISKFNINGKTIEVNPTIIPQGVGSVIDWVENQNNGVYPDRITVLDIGNDTINVIHYQDGKPVRKHISGYVGHGVISIIRPFTNYLENKFSLTFSDQEANKIFRVAFRGKFSGILYERAIRRKK